MDIGFFQRTSQWNADDDRLLAYAFKTFSLDHLENSNFHADWNMPVAPEAYTRSGRFFGDQYSNFNAGKLLLYLEGLAGLEYSIPDNRLIVRDTMPTTWSWMEVRLPNQMPGETKTRWPIIRYQRTARENSSGLELTKSIRVTDCPLQITIEPWSEGKRVIHSARESADCLRHKTSGNTQPNGETLDDRPSTAFVMLHLDPGSATGSQKDARE